jgi:DNA polymerase-3 subunit gamma/tau
VAAQALYRVWRSQTFDELVGQEHVVHTLRNALVEGRIAHAYLFTGPRGVGKTTMARLLAKAVNCTHPEAVERPCGQCESCVAVAEGRAVDVIELDAASHTSVEDAREIIERVQFRPTTGRYKVYIIDETHMLSTAAFNALLKTLEEPPEHALFILATTEVHKVPATILSRCQRFNFARHSVAATTEHLAHIAQSEGLNLEPAAAEIIARSATGSMRDALSVLDQLRAYDNHITAELARSLLGSSASAEVTALVDALLDADMPGALRAVNAVADQGADLRQFARDLVERLRGLLLLSAGGARELNEIGEDELQSLQSQAARATIGDLLAWVKLFSALDFQLRTSPYGQLPLELAVVESLLAPASAASAPAPRPSAPAARPTPQPARPAPPTPAPRKDPAASTDAVRAQHTASQQAAPQQAAPQQAAPPEPAAETLAEAADTHNSSLVTRHSDGDLLPPVLDEPEAAPATPQPIEDAAVQAANADIASLEQIEAVWPQVVRDVRVFDKTLQALLNSGVRPSDVEDGIVVLEVGSEFIFSKLEKPNFRQILERVLSKHTGGSYGIRCVVEAQQRRENPNDLRTQIRQARKDEWVRAAINVFDADIVAVEQHDPAL